MILEKVIKEKYRPEIDGIRAFAVIAVIINHFNNDLLPSGYLGVDIFFLISGFVITSSLSGRKSVNFFEFISSFYERRIKRLVPPLSVFVILISISICFFNPDPQLSLRTGFSSLFGLSNLYLLKQSTDYFAQTTELNVFTHTWSLGVEEQFYLVFPFLIWFSGFGSQTHKGARNLFIIVLFLTIISLFYFIYLYPSNQSAAYFLMPTRFWEMSSGCLLFLLVKKRQFLFKRLRNISPSFIFLLIVGILFLPKSFAITSNILIVFLSALLIICLRKETALFNLFTQKKVIYLGLISYSLYLWHWGVLSISKWTIGVHWWTIPFQLSLTFLLSIFSYIYIEKPLRRKEWSIRRFKTILKGILGLIFPAILLIGLERPLKNKLYLGDIKEKQIDRWDYYDKNCNLISKNFDSTNHLYSAKCFQNGDNKNLFFVGDSHTTALLRGAEFIANNTNSNLIYERTNIPNLSKNALQRFILGLKRREGISKVAIFPLSFGEDLVYLKRKEILKNSKPRDIVFITIRFARFLEPESNLKQWLKALIKFSDELSRKEVNVVLSSPIPEFPLANSQKCRGQNDQWFNKFSKEICSTSKKIYTSKNGKYYELINILNEITNQKNNIYLFNFFEAICPNEKCGITLDGEILYKDAHHISDYAARNVVAPKLLKFLEDNGLLN